MKNRHQADKDRNTASLQASGVPFVSRNNGETLLVREAWGNADFYPSTGKWKDLQSNEIRQDNFIAWCANKRRDYKPQPVALLRVINGRRRKYYLRET